MDLMQTRFDFSPIRVISRFENGADLSLYALERPARDKVPHCVPEAKYELLPYDSREHGQTWCLHNPDVGVFAGASLGHPKPSAPSKQMLQAVAYRLGRRDDFDAGRFSPHLFDYVELHVGNWAHDSLACVLLGEHWDKHNEILESRDAIGLLRSTLGPMTTGHTLTITSRKD